MLNNRSLVLFFFSHNGLHILDNQLEVSFFIQVLFLVTDMGCLFHTRKLASILEKEDWEFFASKRRQATRCFYKRWWFYFKPWCNHIWIKVCC